MRYQEMIELELKTLKKSYDELITASESNASEVDRLRESDVLLRTALLKSNEFLRDAPGAHHGPIKSRILANYGLVPRCDECKGTGCAYYGQLDPHHGKLFEMCKVCNGNGYKSP